MEVECLALKDLSSPRKSSPREEEEEDGCQSEQKENICAGWRRSTPLKSTESAIPALLMGRRGGGATPDLTHITPIKHTPLAEPWTPTANLKMLISAASPDIRSREMKKVLFRPIENEHPASPEAVTDDADVEDSCQFEAAEEEDDAEKKPSRKQKSLGLLCQKFLALYPDYPSPHTPIWISLDEVAASLGVERRRIYDIVNVLESLAIVGRMAKNSYTWYGRLGLDSTLEQLQQRGRQQGYHLQIELAAEAKEAGGRSHNDDGDASHASGNRKDKSLRIMSQKFVMLFLVSKTQTVTLDAAAKILIEESQDSSSHSKYKTKVRRLYDIANVLTSLGLIKKVHVPDERGRKPAFRWLGPVDFNKSRTLVSGSDTVAPPPEATPEIRRTKLARHASFNITPTSAAVRRLVSSAPSSPHRDRTGLTNQPVDYSRKSTVCRLQFGSSTGITAPLSPSRPPLLAPALAPPSPMPCLAYLPSLSQPSVVMLYSAPEGQRSPGRDPEESRKRRREETDGEETTARKKGTTGAEEHGEMRGEPQKKGMECSGLSRGAADEGERTQPSHYLYVPNNAGLNSLNLLLPTGAPPSSLPPASVPTLALPYVLVPSHYPLVAGGLQQQGPDAKLSFSLPTVVSPAHFMVGAAPYGLAAAADVGATSIPSPSTPEQSRLQRSAPGALHSPSGPRHAVRISTPEPLTPHTPKEVPASASKAFFQTPGTLGGTVSSVLAGRKRGSAQRRLDVGHPAAS